jgi:hypothetical protein
MNEYYCITQKPYASFFYEYPSQLWLEHEKMELAPFTVMMSNYRLMLLDDKCGWISFLTRVLNYR